MIKGDVLNRKEGHASSDDSDAGIVGREFPTSLAFMAVPTQFNPVLTTSL